MQGTRPPLPPDKPASFVLPSRDLRVRKCLSGKEMLISTLITSRKIRSGDDPTQPATHVGCGAAREPDASVAARRGSPSARLAATFKLIRAQREGRTIDVTAENGQPIGQFHFPNGGA